MRATGSRVKKKMVIRSNTVGPLLVIYLGFRRGGEGNKRNNRLLQYYRWGSWSPAQLLSITGVCHHP